MELNRYFREDSTTYRKQGIVIFDFDDTKCMEFIEDYIILLIPDDTRSLFCE